MRHRAYRKRAKRQENESFFHKIHRKRAMLIVQSLYLLGENNLLVNPFSCQDRERKVAEVMDQRPGKLQISRKNRRRIFYV